MSTTSPAEYETRIRALEKLNATLAVEIDQMSPVVAAARHWHSLSKYRPDRYFDFEQDLANAVVAYEVVKEQEMKHGQIRATTTKDTGG